MLKSVDFMFTSRYPKLDLHGFDRETARVAINDFVSDNIKMGNKIVVIVHGIGTGVIRETTFNTLKKNKNVLEYKSDYSNRGCTLALLKIDK